jgi:hypothetical protein
MRVWLNGLPSNPRQEPSEEVVREHPHPQDELRLTWLFEADAFIVHALDEHERPRNLYVGRNPPAGLGGYP